MFDTFMLKNHLLSLIINFQTSKCLFLNTLTAIMAKPSVGGKEIHHKSLVSTPSQERREGSMWRESSEDVKQKLNFFIMVTHNGTNCQNFDPEMTSKAFFLCPPEHQT